MSTMACLLGGITLTIVSERLQELREQRNIMQKDVAASINVPLRTYQRYEYGEIDPKLAVAARIADFYGVTIDYLAGRTDVP